MKAIIFYSVGIGILPTKISSRQKSALQLMQANNNHTNVRIRLAELFHAPKDLIKCFKGIEARAKKNGCLEYNDFNFRRSCTEALNNYIRQTYGKDAEDFALSVE